MKYSKKFPEMLINHMEQGFSFSSFGGTIRVHRATLDRWKKKYPKFEEAYELGKTMSELHWEKLGMEGLYEIVQKDEEGNINRLKMNATMWIFNMKNRFGWRDKKEIEQTVSGDININATKDDLAL